MRDQIAADRNTHWIQNPAEANPRHRAWLEVSDSAIEANARSLKRHLGPSCDLMAVVKADGYGHGAETVAKASVRGGQRALVSQPSKRESTLGMQGSINRCLCWGISPNPMTSEPVCNGG